MARRSRKRPYGAPHREFDPARGGNPPPHVEIGPGGEEYVVAHARLSVKTYVCPGCGHHIAPGRPHLVTWPTESIMGHEAAVESRRHWHTACWERFGRTGE